jgi:hypothetical protein
MVSGPHGSPNWGLGIGDQLGSLITGLIETPCRDFPTNEIYGKHCY